MKKRILFFVLMLAFILAISVGAKTVISESNLDENGDIVADIVSDLGNNHHLVSVDITYDNKDGENVNGKFYFTTNVYYSRRQVAGVYVPADFDLSQMIYFLDKADYNGNGTYDGNELIKHYQGDSNHKYMTYTAFDNESKTLTEGENIKGQMQALSYSKYIYMFPGNGFANKDAVSLKTVTYNGREPIEGAFIISPTVTSISQGSFGGDGTTGKNTAITQNTKLIFEDREGTLSIGKYCFFRFKFEEIYFGKGTYSLYGTESIGMLFERLYNNGEGATLKTVVIHKDAIIKNGTISWDVGNYDVVVLGKEADSKAHYEANNQGVMTCAKSVTYNPCYYGHTYEDDFNCATPLVCSACDAILAEATEHNLQKSIAYKNGYLSSGIKNEKCLNEGCQYEAELIAPAIFTTNGYSIPEDGRGQIAICFAVNKDALYEYESVMREELTYGVFAIAYNNIDKGEILDNEKAIKSEINRDFVAFEMKITGIQTEAQMNANISFGAYIINKAGEVAYLQAGTPNEGEAYYYVSYNSILNGQGEAQ